MILKEGPTFQYEGTEIFAVSDYLEEGTKIGDYVVTYIGPNFARHFADVVEENLPALSISTQYVQRREKDAEILKVLGEQQSHKSKMAHLFETLFAGANGPGLFNGFSNLIYKISPLDGKIYTPHWYIRGNRIGFGALPFDDDEGWEVGDVFLTNES